MKNSAQRFLLAALLCVFALPAFAHPGHGGGFVSGVVHPFSGLDHLLAMLGIGVWSARQAGRARYLLPTLFLTSLVVSGLTAAYTQAIPLASVIETGLAVSVFAIGVLIALGLRLPLVLSASLIGSFGLLHGYAHGLEMPTLAAPLAYASGFLLSSSVLLGLGIAFGIRGESVARASARLGGVCIALCGAGLLLVN